MRPKKQEKLKGFELKMKEEILRLNAAMLRKKLPLQTVISKCYIYFNLGEWWDLNWYIETCKEKYNII